MKNTLLIATALMIWALSPSAARDTSPVDLIALTGPRMDEGGPIAHPHVLAHFHTKAECEKKALKIVKENTLPGQSTSYSCGGDNEKEYWVPVPLPEVYVVLIGRVREPAGLHWEPQSVWSTKDQCLIEADKKQSEASQPDYDHGGNRNWPAFRCAVYKPTVKRAMGYDETPLVR
jgi:hypothetical protein